MKLTSLLACLALPVSLSAQQYMAQPPLTTPESTEWNNTSTSEHVRDFLGKLESLPAATRLSVTKFGETNEGRDMLVVRVSAGDATGKLRILVNANIHGGEVEGKEAVQILLREFARGEHANLLESADIWFVPIYNLDGNDRMAEQNRRSQNGPDGGVGVRPNAQDLDLNRDFIKADSPEARALIGLVRQHDPHLFMDLHTTNGSTHGYHLTYSPSLATNVDPGIDNFMRLLFLPEARRNTLDVHGYRVFDYGNFGGGGGQRGRGRGGRRGAARGGRGQRGTRGEGRGRGQGRGRGRGAGGAASTERRWSTYDHRPRFGTNYIGLRNRLSVLSEALSYLDFKNRILATRGFVLENLESAVRHKEQIEELCAAADRRVTEPNAAIYFGHDTTLVDGTIQDILVGTAEQVALLNGRTRRVITDEFRPEPMRVQVAYRSRKQTALPRAWAISEPSRLALEKLAIHGIEVRALLSRAQVRADVFRPTAINRSERLYQGHNETSLDGAWHSVEQTLPEGTVVILALQPLARLAAQLLEPMSEDSLSTWQVFEQETRAGGEGYYPVLHLNDLEGLALGPVTSRQPRNPTPAPEPEATPNKPFEGETVRSISVLRESNGEAELLFGEAAELLLADLEFTVGDPLRHADLQSYAQKYRLDKNGKPRFELTEEGAGVDLRIFLPHVE